MNDMVERLREKAKGDLLCDCFGRVVGRSRADPLFREAADRIAALEAVITALIDDAMPSNWDDEDHESEHVEAWRNAMQAIGYDPAAGEENG